MAACSLMALRAAADAESVGRRITHTYQVTLDNSTYEAGKGLRMIEVADILGELGNQRPVFHSEADFQHAFAWALHRRLPDAKVRLEFPVSRERGRWYLDVWVVQGNAILAVELKYKTRALSV